MGRALGLTIECNANGCYRVSEDGQKLHEKPWLSPFYTSQLIRTHRAKL
jgi:hypothetical protein